MSSYKIVTWDDGTTSILVPAWESLCVMPIDNDEPARRAREIEAKIAQGVKEAKGGLVCNAISALHGQHSYNGRPNRFVPE